MIIKKTLGRPGVKVLTTRLSWTQSGPGMRKELKVNDVNNTIMENSPKEILCILIQKELWIQTRDIVERIDIIKVFGRIKEGGLMLWVQITKF